MLVYMLCALLAGACMAMPTGNDTAAEASSGGRNVTTTEEVTTTQDPFCEGFRPGDEARTYQRFAAGRWHNLSCPGPLVWVQDTCSCGARFVEIQDPNCPSNRPYPGDPTKFEVLDHGVWRAVPMSCPQGYIWFQEFCWCDEDPDAPPTAPPSTTTVSPDEEAFTRRTTPRGPFGNTERFVVTRGVLAGSENTTGSPRVNATYCANFRPTQEANRYQVFAAGRYYNFTCQSPLVWNQIECTCTGREVEITDANCPHHRPYLGDITKFEVRDFGVWLAEPFDCPENHVWNQTNCWCDIPWWDETLLPAQSESRPPEDSGTAPCYPVFNATFDRGIFDEGRFSFSIGREPWPDVTVVQNVLGAKRGAARLVRARMPLWFTIGNALGGTIQLQFRFKVIEGAVPDDTDIVLVGNNRCLAGPKTLSISFRPNDERYTVFFRDYNVSRTMECNSPSRNTYGFHTLDMIFFNELLTLTVDGEECFGALFETDLLPTNCYIALGSRHFNGYFDDVVIRRDCLEQETPVVAA